MLRPLACAALVLGGCRDYDALTLCTEQPEHPDCRPGCLGESRCDHAGASLLCDGFEDGVDADAWSSVEEGGAVAGASDVVCRGQGAARFTAESGADVARRGAIATPMVSPERAYFARVYFQVEPDPPFRFELLAMQGSQAPNPVARFAIEDGSLSLVVGGVKRTDSQFGVDPERWFCLEVELVEATAGRVRVTLDDLEVESLAFDGDTELAAPVDELVVGMEVSDTEPQGGAVRVDELLLDTEPIGCAR